MIPRRIPLDIRIRQSSRLQDHLAHSIGLVHEAMADFTFAILEAQTVSEALRLQERLAPLVALVDTIERMALERADRILKEQD